ncbi:hypothetical protein PJL18_04222 [Paenarthrobacter nicotinovorans]|nr:hypothetical protein [Paenarthrobacter nicotinovorans]
MAAVNAAGMLACGATSAPDLPGTLADAFEMNPSIRSTAAAASCSDVGR